MAEAGDLRDGVVDAYLVFTELLQEPNTVLNAAAPAADLPKLQLVSWGSALMGFGDLFIAAVLGALLARDRASRPAEPSSRPSSAAPGTSSSSSSTPPPPPSPSPSPC